jgi:hypothetical protein
MKAHPNAVPTTFKGYFPLDQKKRAGRLPTGRIEKRRMIQVKRYDISTDQKREIAFWRS